MSWTERLLVAVTVLSLLGAVGLYAYRRQSALVPDPVGSAHGGAHEAPEALASVDDAAYAGGQWFVVDSRAHQVHALDSLGRYVRSMGRKGRGPGEFVIPNLVAASAAHVYVAEMTRTAISVFDRAGEFVRQLRVPGDCAAPGVVAMAVEGTTLYVLRQCMEPPRMRYRVERSVAGERLENWNAIADTLPFERNALELRYPLMSVGAGRLVLGDGGRGCLRIVGLADGRSHGTRCLDELPRLATSAQERARLVRRSRGRITPPDSLPRALRVSIDASGLAVLTPDNVETATWYAVPWGTSAGTPTPLGRAHLPKSFVMAGRQLLAWDEVDGVRIEVLHVSRQ